MTRIVTALILMLGLAPFALQAAEHNNADAASSMERLINTQLEAARRCTSDEQCTILQTSCPFGCGQPVNRDFVPLLEAALTVYEDEFGTPCMYRCRPPAEVACVEQRCVSIPPADESVNSEDPVQ